MKMSEMFKRFKMCSLDQEVMKKSGRDEPIRVLIHMCMEAMLGISLYSYLYPNQQKCFVFLIIAYVFSSTKLDKRAEQVLPGSEVGGEEREGMGGRGRDGPMYEHINK
jgi:hypothetical protein